MDDKLNETIKDNEEAAETQKISLDKSNDPEAAPVQNDEPAAEQTAENKGTASAPESSSKPDPSASTGSKPNSTDMKKEIKFQTVDPSQKNEKPEKKGSLAKKAGIAVAALFVLYVVFAAAFSIGKKYERPVKYYYKAIEKGDGKYLEKAFGDVVREELDEVLKNNNGKSKKYEDIDDASDVYTASAVMMHKDYMEEYGPGFKIKVEVIGKEKMKKDELKKVNEKLKKKDVDHKVKKGYFLRTNTVLKSKESNQDIESKDLVEVFLIDNEWVFFDDSSLKADDLSSFEGFLQTYDRF